jgi:putative FmdB family regulatory protein
MPTYDYKCSACSHTFEHMQSMRDKPLRKCPKCGKAALERLIGTGGAIIFKGGGFYQTDYRSESYKKAAEAESKPKEAATPASTKAETAAQPEPVKTKQTEPRSKPSEPAASKSPAGKRPAKGK